MINRKIEQRILEDLENSQKIVILYGSRQVGKTTLIKKVIRQLNKKTLSIDADSGEYQDVLSGRNPLRLERLIGDHELLFIDEAQRIPDIGINLKIIHDQIPHVKVIVSGSSSLDLANRVSEPLTGRSWTYNLYPIAFDEWREFRNLSTYFSESQLEELLLFGFYPEVLTISGKDRKIQYLNELRRSYLYKDVLALGNIRYPEKLDQLVKLLAFQIGQLVSLQELADNLQVNRDTIVNYIDLLEKSFVIFRLQGYSRNLRKEITKMSKIYFYDLGVRNAVINNFNPLNLRNDRGYLWENFMIVERKKWLAYQFSYANTYFWRTHTGAEVDYIEEKDGHLYGYEFKWNPRKIKKSYAPWESAYPEATYSCITTDQIEDFIL